jgi:hypothetical protein
MADSFLNRVIRRRAPQQRGDASLEALASAVRDLATAQQKQAAQLKKLVDAQKESDHRWQEALDRWQHAARETSRREQHEADRTRERGEKRWQTRYSSLEHSLKTERKWRLIFARQMNAVIRALHFSRLPLAPPYDILARRFRLWSQNEEDGIILGLLERAGTTTKRFVEIGSGQSGGNAAMLAYECGWSGLMIDIVPEAIELLRARFAHNPGVIGVAAAVTPANVNQLITDHGFSGDVDLLSIDIDSYEYWVLDALTACTPRLLVVEYNAAFGPSHAVTIPRDQSLVGAPKNYRGASLGALEKAARRKGYRLVMCDPTGVNAFFLRDDVAPDVPAAAPARAFRQLADRWELADVPVADDATLMAGGLPLVEV